MFPDDESESEDSTTAASDAAAAIRDHQASLSRFSDEDEDKPLPPTLCTDESRSEGAASSQAGKEGTGEKEDKKEEGLCDGFRYQETESGIAHRGELACGDVEVGAGHGLDAEEDETDEELANDSFGTISDEEDVETDVEVESGTWDRTGHRRQRRGEDGEADADGVGKGVDTRADGALGSPPPPVEETPSRKTQQRQLEPNGERASVELPEIGDGEKARSSVGDEERTDFAGAEQDGSTPASPALRMSPMIQVRMFPRTLPGRWGAQSCIRHTESPISYTRCPAATGHHGHGWRARYLERAPERGKPYM